MRWAEAVAESLAPSFGGFPTFCSDPDDLLEEPAVREALVRRGVTLSEWTGERGDLLQWSQVADDDKPLIKINEGAFHHFIDEALSNATRLDVGVSALFSKLDADVVRAVPRVYWDALLRLQEHERPLRTRRESALMVARAVYGVDHVFVKENGWLRVIAQLAASGDGLPSILAEELVACSEGRSFEGVREALRDVVVARAFVKGWASELSDPVVAALKAPEVKEPFRSITYDEKSLMAGWERADLSAMEIQALALRYGAALVEGASAEVRRRCNAGFRGWLRQSYDLMLTAQNPSVLRIHRLADSIDARLGGDRGVVFVVDALGLESWLSLKRQWVEDGIISGAKEDAAFAIIPTLTCWSRRAFFEGKLPTQFEKGKHGPAMERRLWERRFVGGRYFDVGEDSAFEDAVYQGCSRIAVVDVSWDKRGHAIDPEYDDLPSEIRRWGAKSRIVPMVMLALENGYRAFVVADHGQLGGKGVGLPNVGTVPEDRSKRVLVFGTSATRDDYEGYGETDLRPITMPKDAFPLFARYGETFDLKGGSSFSHGGCSIEEVMIPVVELRP